MQQATQTLGSERMWRERPEGLLQIPQVQRYGDS